ncbi:hypothetical protein PINS_up012665 [Pythium insidiosum]|nr:hypothetical protein PINS_up012665 [Pythium insidiosum]
MHRSVEKELEAADCLHEDPLLRRAGVSPLLSYTKEEPGFSLPELVFSPRHNGSSSDTKARGNHSSPLLAPQDDGERWHDLSLLPPVDDAGDSDRSAPSAEMTADLFPSLLDDDDELRLKIDAPLNMDAMIPFPMQTPTQRIVGFHSFFKQADDAGRSSLVSPFKDSVQLLSPTAMDKKVLVTENDLKLVSPDESLRRLQGKARAQQQQHQQQKAHRSTRVAPYESTRKSKSSIVSRVVRDPPVTLVATPAAPSLKARRWRERTHAQGPLHSVSTSVRSPDARHSPTSPSLECRGRQFAFAHDALAGGYDWSTPAVSDAASRSPAASSRRLPGIAALPRVNHAFDWQAMDHAPVTVATQRWGTEPRPMTCVGKMAAMLRSPRAYEFAPPPARPARVLPTRKIGIYSPEQRRERIRRFHEKRKQRVFHKRVKYDCRKRLAIACPRIKGRFVKREEYEQAMAASTTTAETSSDHDVQDTCGESHGTGLTDEESGASEPTTSPWMPEPAGETTTSTLSSGFLVDLAPSHHSGSSQFLQLTA